MTIRSCPARGHSGPLVPLGAFLALAFAGATLPATAQVTVRVDSTAACTTCQIELGLSLELSGPFQDGSLPHAGLMLLGEDGRVYGLFEGHRDQVHVYGPDGSFSGQQIGGRGEGPGEFQALTYMHLQEGVLRTFDAFLLRRTDFDLRTGEVLRTVSLPLHWQSLVLEEGVTVLSGSVATRDAAGHPLHVYDADGVWLRSFGFDEPVLRPDLRSRLHRQLAASGASTFWAAWMNAYRIEEWDTEGRLVRVLVGDRSWFEPWEVRPGPRSRDIPPSPSVRDISVDSEGLLWVLFTVPAANWADALSDEVDVDGSALLLPGRPYRESILEVIDPLAGHVLARRRIPAGGLSFAGPGTLVSSWIDADGLPRGELTPVRVTGR
jgi:hypothetical protein